MHDSNDELLDRIIKDEPPASSRNEQLGKALARWFEGRRNFALLYMAVLVLASAVPIMLGFYVVFGPAKDLRLLLVAIAAMGLGLSINVLVKLWYAIVDTKISVAKELKLMQLSLLGDRASDDADMAVPDGEQLERLLPDDFFKKQGSLLARIRPKTACWIVKIVLVMGVIGLVFVAQAVVPRFLPKAGVAQTDEWHVTSTGEVLADSQISFERYPDDGAFMTIALPYADARVTSVTAAGAPLPYHKLDWRRYEVQLPIYPFGWEGQRTVDVGWTFPMDALLRMDRGFRTTLTSLLPVDSYSLDVVLDPDSGFEVIDEPGAHEIHPFSGSGRPPRQLFGSCGIWIREKG